MTWRIDPGGSQTEGEIAEQLTGRGMVGKEETIKEDDAFHGGPPTGQGAELPALRSSHYRVFARDLHRDSSTHDLEQDANATGIVEAL